MTSIYTFQVIAWKHTHTSIWLAPSLKLSCMRCYCNLLSVLLGDLRTGASNKILYKTWDYLNAGFHMMVTWQIAGSITLILWAKGVERVEREKESPNHLIHFMALSTRAITVQIRLGAEHNWANSCFSLNSPSNFPSWKTLIDKDIFSSTPHSNHSSAGLEGGLALATQGACSEPSNLPWKSIIEEGHELNYLY